MSESNSAYDFLKLMGSAASAIPTKRKLTPNNKYKFRCTFSEYNKEHTFKDGSTGFQFSVGLQAIANLTDPADDLGNVDTVWQRWNNRSPDFMLEELAEFIREHGFRNSFEDAAGELKGRFYEGSITPAKNNPDILNVRGLKPVA